MLALFETQDRLEFNNASPISLKVVCALMPKLTNASQTSPSPASPSTPPDLVAFVSQDPFIKMEFLSKPEKIRIKSMVEKSQLPKQQALRTKSDEEIFVPIIPNRCIELQVSTLDNIMWQIPCITHPPHISIPLASVGRVGTSRLGEMS